MEASQARLAGPHTIDWTAEENGAQIEGHAARFVCGDRAP